MGTCLFTWWIESRMYESEATHFNFLLLPVLKLWNLAMKVPQNTLLLNLLIYSVNIVECLLYAGHHKRFEYDNNLKECLINWGRLCSKQITFRISLKEFLDWMLQRSFSALFSQSMLTPCVLTSTSKWTSNAIYTQMTPTFSSPAPTTSQVSRLTVSPLL